MKDLVVLAESRMSLDDLYVQSLDLVKETDDLKQLVQIDDQAERLRVFSLKVVKESEYANRFAEVRIRTQRKVGTILKKTIKAGNPQLSSGSNIGTLYDFGITRDHSSQYQKIATLPKWAFEHYLVATASPSTAAAVKSADKYIRFLKIVEGKPAEERTEFMRTGMLGNMTIKDFTEMVNPTPKTTTKSTSKTTTAQKTTKKSDKVPIKNRIIDFFTSVESVEVFLEQLEGMVGVKNVVIKQSDLDRYEEACRRFFETFKKMKKIGNKMKRRIIKNV